MKTDQGTVHSSTTGAPDLTLPLANSVVITTELNPPRASVYHTKKKGLNAIQ